MDRQNRSGSNGAKKPDQERELCPYFKQLEVVSEAAVKGAYDGKRKGMNRPLKSEDKLDPDEKALIDRMKRFTASIKDQDERAALSF